MSDDYPLDSLDQMFDTVNDGLKWSVKQVRSACPWRQKKEDGSKSPDGYTQKGATDDGKQSKGSARIGAKQSEDSARIGGKQSEDSARIGGKQSDDSARIGGKQSDDSARIVGKQSDDSARIGGKQSDDSARIDSKQSEDSARIGGKQSKDSAQAGDDGDASKRGSDKSGKYAAPSQIYPQHESPCCFIKMQDPCSPCCCDNKPPPCISTNPDPPRDPTCGCDLCKKGYPNDRCCDHREAFRRATTGPRHFEKA